MSGHVTACEPRRWRTAGEALSAVRGGGCGCKLRPVPHLRIPDAAALLGVSDDTVRRWAEHGRLNLVKVGSRSVVDGRELAELAQELADTPHPASPGIRSARNSLRGIVTRVVRDTVMAQVEMQAGPFRVVSLMSREAADELALEAGTVAYASVKATNVVIELETPTPRSAPQSPADQTPVLQSRTPRKHS